MFTEAPIHICEKAIAFIMDDDDIEYMECGKPYLHDGECGDWR